MKKLISYILIATLIFTMIPYGMASNYVCAAETSNNEFIFTEAEDGVIVTGLTDTLVTDLIIPSEIDGMPVIGIADSAFAGNSSLKSIVIPSSVTKVGNMAFAGCISLESIELGEGIVEIGEYAFDSCAIAEIVLPNSITTLGKQAFGGCEKLVSLTLPDNLSVIPELMLSDYGSLKTLKIPSKVSKISYMSLGTGMETLYIPKSVTTIEAGCFYECLENIYYEGTAEEWNNIIIDENNVIKNATIAYNYSKDSAENELSNSEEIYYDSKSSDNDIVFKFTTSNTGVDIYGISSYTTTDLIIPDYIDGMPVTTISMMAFDDENFESLRLPKYLVEIESYAFENCKNLTGEIVVPDSVTTLGTRVFWGCSKITGVKLPENIQSIPDGFFSGCKSLETVSYSDNLTSIGQNAFNGCQMITKINFPTKLKTVGEYAFAGMTGITELTIPETVTEIKRGAFSNCSNLKRVTVPKSVTLIEYEAFGGCKSLEHITLPFAGKSKTAGTLGYIFGTESGKSIHQILSSSDVSASTMRINDSADYSLPTSLRSVSITGDGITSGAFSGCEQLTNIELSEGITEIGSCAFYSCKGLEKIKLPSTIKTISRRAFSYCDNLKEITIPNGTTGIGNYAFYKCDNLEKVSLSGGISTNHLKNSYLAYTGDIFYVSGNQEAEILLKELNKKVVSLCLEDAYSEQLIAAKPGKILIFVDDVIDISELLISNEAIDIDQLSVKVKNPSVAMYYEGKVAGLYEGETELIVEYGENCCVVNLTVSDSSIETSLIAIDFKDTTVNMLCGEEKYNPPIFEPVNATDVNVTWESSKESIVEIDENGFIKAKNPGSASITCSNENGIKGAYEVNVTAPLEKIIILPIEELVVGEEKSIDYYFYPYNTDDSNEIAFSSSNSDILTINKNGLIKAIAPGKAYVTVKKGDISCTSEINVVEPLVGIQLNASSKQLYMNEQYQLSVNYEPTDTTDDKTVIWKSSDENVALVDSNGVVTAVGVGIATITAQVGEFSDTCRIICPSVPLVSISFTETSKRVFYGETFTLDIILNPVNTTDTIQDIRWESSDENVVAVDNSGTLEARNVGSAKVSAIVGDYVAICDVTVNKAIPVYNIPQGIIAHEGDFLRDVQLPQGFEWKNIDDLVDLSVENYNATYVPEDLNNYRIVENISVKVEIHKWKTDFIIDKEPSCTEAGFKSIHCSVCDATKDAVSIGKTAHKYGDWIIDKEATCTESGEKHRECKNCDAKKTGVIDIMGHSYSSTYTADKKATTSADGSKSKHCTRSGCTAKSSVTPIYKASSVKLSTVNYTYNGSAKKPSVTVKNSKGTTLKNGTDYTVTYASGRKKIGKYKVTVKFKGAYRGSKALYFEIGPKNPSSVKTTLYGSNDVKVSWSKVSGASGYKVYYKKSSASSWKLLKTTTATSYKKANLSDGVKYDFKVVTYKKVSGNACENAGKTSSIYTLKKVAGVKAAKSGTKVKVSWTNISGETGYEISQSTSKSGTKVVATYKTTSGKYKTVSATKGKTYYYKVRAYKVVGKTKIYGPWSTVVKYKR